MAKLDSPLSMPQSLIHLLALCAVAAAGAAHAQDAAFKRCPGIADPAARLACYDAIQPPTGRPVGPTAAAAAATLAAPAPVATAAAGKASPGPAQIDNADNFGFPARARPGEVRFIESAVADDFDGWSAGDKIRLKNGQVWRVDDGSQGAIRPANRKVRVVPGALGSFHLEFEGLSRSPRVSRVQ